MADRNFARDAGALEKGLVKLFAHVAFGATGAPTLVRAKGIATVSRDSAGKFVLTLEDRYQRLLGAHGMFVGTSPAAAVVSLVSDDSAALSPTLTFQTSAADSGAATDPGSGEELLLELSFSNSAAL